MEEYKKITVNVISKTYNITKIMYTLLYNQLQFFHFTLSKIILMKFAKLRNFVLSFIMRLNLSAEGCT